VFCEWRKFNVDNFADDLAASKMFLSPPSDVNAAFDCYDGTLRSLIDSHAPLVSSVIFVLIYF
jgi:hypothetical protein